MIEKKEKIFLGIVALYIIVALCFYTFNSIENFIGEILVGGLIVLVMFIKSRKLYIGIREILVFATVISWGIITEQLKLALATAILWFIYIYITKFLMHEGINRGIAEKVMWGIIITLTVGFTIHAVVDAGIFFVRSDWSSFMALTYRDGTWTDSWWDCFAQCDIVRTQIGFLLLNILTCTLPLCIGNIPVTYKILVYFADALLLIANLRSCGGGRIPFVCFFAAIFVQTSMYIFDREKSNKINNNKLVRIVIGLSATSLIVYVICRTNVAAQGTLCEMIKRDGGLFNNIRFKWQTDVMKNILNYPMGVGNPENSAEIYGFWYSHNMWVDMLLYAGIIPFLTFVSYTIYSIVDLLKFLWNNKCILLKMAVGGTYLGYMLYYTVEPAFYASIEFIVPWLMLNTTLNAYNSSREQILSSGGDY